MFNQQTLQAFQGLTVLRLRTTDYRDGNPRIVYLVCERTRPIFGFCGSYLDSADARRAIGEFAPMWDIVSGSQDLSCMRVLSLDVSIAEYNDKKKRFCKNQEYLIRAWLLGELFIRQTTS